MSEVRSRFDFDLKMEVATWGFGSVYSHFTLYLLGAGALALPPRNEADLLVLHHPITNARIGSDGIGE